MLVDTSDLVSVTELGRGLSRFVNEAAGGGRRFVILNSNTPTAALVSIADLETLNALDAAPSPEPNPVPVAHLDRPAQSDLEARPGYSAVGRSADGEPVYWPLNGHVFATGRPGVGLGQCLSAAIAGAVPDPDAPTEFVVVASNPYVPLRHARVHPEIPIAVALDLREPDIRRRFVEQLQAEIDRRKGLLRELRVETLDELRQLGPTAELAAQMPNVVVVLTDSDSLTGGGAEATEPDLSPALFELLQHGPELGMYLWLGIVTSHPGATLNHSVARNVSFRVVLGSVESSVQSREMLGTDVAARAVVSPGTGWCLAGRGASVREFAVAAPTGEHGHVVTASGTCTSWRPWLTQPLALGDIPGITPDDAERGLTFPIGVSNPPWEALTVSVNDETPHVCLVGGKQSGNVDALETVIAAALLRYAPSDCAFLVIDDDGLLASAAGLGNVAAYASTRDDAVERILGEALRIINIRRSRFATDELSSFDEYAALARPGADLRGPQADPYGRLIVMIAGMEAVMSDQREMLTDVLRYGGPVGVHVVAAAERSIPLPRDVYPFMSFPLRFGGTDVTEVPTLKLRTLARGIPDGQPGRCVDLRTGRHGRIAGPIRGQYQPDAVPAERSMSDLGGPLGDPVQRLQIVSKRVDGEEFWREVDDRDRNEPAGDQRGGRRAAAQVRLPLGLGVADGQVVDVPAQRSPHLVVVGATGSGRSATLRALIESIRRRFSPDGLDGRPEAKVVVIDERDELDTEHLAADGYLLTTERSPVAELEAVAANFSERTPSPEGMSSGEVLRYQSWYDRPEVFVVIDTDSVRDQDWVSAAASIAEARRDSRVHLYLSDTAAQYATKRLSHRLHRALSDAPTLLLSGPPSAGVIWGGSGIRFTQRPPGRGLLVDQKTLESQTIQIPWYWYPMSAERSD